jgi:hypothetical protein
LNIAGFAILLRLVFDIAALRRKPQPSLPILATGKSPEPAGWKACATLVAATQWQQKRQQKRQQKITKGVTKKSATKQGERSNKNRKNSPAKANAQT